MFLKNNMRPAESYASGRFSAPSAESNRHSSLSYNMGTSEAEDFNAFHPQAGREDMAKRSQGPSQRPHRKRTNTGLIVAVAVAVALLVLIAVIIAVAIASGGAITYESNAYIAYADVDGNYHVSVNGTVLDHKFEGEVQVIPSADHAFAYVTDTGAEGTHVYILNGKKLEDITSSYVSEVLAFATLEPGVIFLENDKFYLYSEEVGEEMITKDISADNFLISGDATTVAYTTAVENSSGEIQLCLYQDGSSDKVTKNCVPVAVSNYGDYVYGSALDKEGRTNLYVITAKDQEKILVEDSSGFDGITAMNVKGDEVLFRTSNGTDTTTYVYRFDGDNSETVKLAKGYLIPATVDPSVSIAKTFADSYLTGMNLLDSNASVATYHLTKKFEIKKISSYSGKFSADGNYFYYINKDMTLVQLDLTDDNYPKESVDEDVVDFAITEKGNIYSLNDSNQLRYYKVSAGKKSRISDDATAISLYNYANEIYFSEAEAVDVNVYTSEEGSQKDIAKMDSTQITSVPFFSNPTAKRSYAYYYDIDNGWMIFYTSGGKNFKMISNDCQAINGVEIPDMLG